MKTSIKIFENNKLTNIINFKTKKTAKIYKKSYLNKFTVHQKVKNKIEVTFSKFEF